MTHAQDSNFHIYLCFGQSNMEGQGVIEKEDRTVDPRFQVLQSLDCSNLGKNKGEWRTAIPPLCQCWSKLSPADYFGRTMVSNLSEDIKIGVINVAVGGCKIELFDKDIYQDYDSTYTEDWFQNKIRDYGGNPYAHMIELAKQAQQDGIIKGILLHQGESNTGDSQWPQKVKKIYNNLMVDLELNPDSVPLLAGEVVHANQGGICASMNTIIAKLPNTLPNSYIVSSDGCSDSDDNIHFNSKGYRMIGKRYAIKMLELMGVEYTDTTNVGIKSMGSIGGYKLNDSYPNPTQDKIFIEFDLPENSHISLTMVDVRGNEVAELASGEFSKGLQIVQFDTSSLASGIYFYTLATDRITMSKKMIKL